MRTRTRLLGVAGGAGVLGGLVLLFFIAGGVGLWRTPTPQSADTPVLTTSDVPDTRRLIDGVPVSDPADSAPPVGGVMIENAADAQPTDGLSHASLVFEAMAESNITRFLAVFVLDEALRDVRIGPVRSARPYYVGWMSELGGLYAHVGGSPDALALLDSAPIIDLDQYFHDSAFWRTRTRSAPHNVYTTGERLMKAAADKDLTQSVFALWKYREESPLSQRVTRARASVVVPYSGVYEVTWEYDADANAYTRMQWGGVHADGGVPISAKNLVVLYQDTQVLDAVGRKRITTVGSGDALMCAEGICNRGTWAARTGGRTTLFDERGNEFQFIPGRTWVMSVPREMKAVERS